MQLHLTEHLDKVEIQVVMVVILVELAEAVVTMVALVHGIAEQVPVVDLAI